MRVLVTGATGFIGKHLIVDLRKRGWDIVCLVRGHLPAFLAGLECYPVDLAQPDSVDLAMAKVGALDVIFHVGALLPNKQDSIGFEEFIGINAISTYRLLQIASAARVKSFVFASSLPIIGKPQDLPITEKHPVRPKHPYLLSKLTAELACEMFRCQESLNVTSLRLTSPYGPGMPCSAVLGSFVDKALCSQNLEIYGSGQRVQNFIHISDVIRAFILAAQTDSPGVYNIAGSASSMLSLAEQIISIIPSSSKIVFSNTPDPQEDYRWQVDMSKACDYLGYTPQKKLDIGLRDYINWRVSGESAELWSEES